jgi:TetR/AcrR family transcriptional regulator
VTRAPATPAAERRAHAVRALLDLARHTAPDQISTAAIAERMGVSHGALFRHFPNREALWAEAVTWATGELDARFAACALPSPLAEVAALMAGHAALLADHPGLVRMLFAELQRPASSPARDAGKAFMQRFRRRLATLFAAAQAEATFDPQLEPEEWAALLVATQQGLMLQALAHDGFSDLAERSRRSVALLLRTATLAVPTGAPVE